MPRCPRCNGPLIGDVDGEKRCLLCGRKRTVRLHEEPAGRDRERYLRDAARRVLRRVGGSLKAI